MAKEELLEFPGVVTELLPNATFRFKLENKHEIIAHTAGRMRKSNPCARWRQGAGGNDALGFGKGPDHLSVQMIFCSQ
jgi:hypothetical protein